MCALVIVVQTCALPICADRFHGHDPAARRQTQLLADRFRSDEDGAGAIDNPGGVTRRVHMIYRCDLGVFRETHGIHAHLATLCERGRSEEHTSELQSLMRISYAVFCLKKKNIKRRDEIT